MFDGPTTTGLDLSSPLVVLDLSALYSSAALGVLMACATAWLQAALARTAVSAGGATVGPRSLLPGGRRGVGDPVEPRRGPLVAVVVEAVPRLRRLQRGRAAPGVRPAFGRGVGLRAGGAGAGSPLGFGDPSRLRAVAGRAGGRGRAAFAVGHRDRSAPTAAAGHRLVEGRPAIVPGPAPTQCDRAVHRRYRRRHDGAGRRGESPRRRPADRPRRRTLRRHLLAGCGGRGGDAGLAPARDAEPAGPGGATCARCGWPPRVRRRDVCSSACGPAWRGSPAWPPNQPSRSSWSGRPRAARPRAWPSRRFWGGVARCWRPASRAISSATRWGRGRGGARCGASTPRAATGARASTWSPLTGCGEWREACRSAADLCEAAKSEGTTADGEFWYATAGKLLAPLFVAAALDGRTMADVVRWVDTQEVGEVAAILERAAATEVLHAAEATWSRDDRTRSSVYTTAETVLAPFAHQPPGPPAGGTFEPGHLLRDANTLYLCAPAHDQRRLRGYFTALTQAVLAHAFASATKSGRPLDPPLLVVLDEAAHIAPLPELDGLGGDLRLARDPDRDGLAGPGAGAGPLRRPGADGAQQPPGQAVPARHRRSRHARVRQPAHR